MPQEVLLPLLHQLDKSQYRHLQQNLHYPRLYPVVVVVQHPVVEVVYQVAVQAVAVVALQVENRHQSNQESKESHLH